MMAAKVNPVSGNVEVKRRDKKEDGLGQNTESGPATQPVTFADGRCNCCPYGYHIDLDFLNFCKNITDGSALTNLKRIQRTKRKLRKSMEMMLEQQQQHYDDSTAAPTPAHPPDVVHSTEASRLINMVNYEQSATHQVLRDIDSSVNATLASIDSMQRSKPPSHRYLSSDSDDAFSYSPLSPVSASSVHSQQSHFDAFPSQPPPPPPRKSSLRFAHQSNGEESSHMTYDSPDRKDSISSLSSVSTVSSEQVSGGMYGSGTHSVHSTDTSPAVTRHSTDLRYKTAMTSESLASTMAVHFPPKELDGSESPTSPMSPNTNISKASLAAIKEAMAVSLQRMRDLEEQVKAIPILQVRISVLKEEKRLLALQLKAKSGNISTCSVGVGENTVDSTSPNSPSPYTYSKPSSRFFPLQSPTVKTPPPTLPKPSRVKTVGVGDHSVVEPYLLQPDLPTGYTISDNQVQCTIQSWQIVDGQKTKQCSPGMNQSTDLTWGLPCSQDVVKATSHTPVLAQMTTIGAAQQHIHRPTTRSIGVGDGSVNDCSLQIYEKELRTVIINSHSSSVDKRNVGVEVKVPTRSIGVSYSVEEFQPATRTVGVNVTVDSSNSSTSVDHKGVSAFSTALQGMLHPQVRSVGTNCNFQTAVTDRGTQYDLVSVVSVSCGADISEVSPPKTVTQCTFGMMAKPQMTHQSISTDRSRTTERAVGTEPLKTCDKVCSTDFSRRTVSMNTDRLAQGEYASQTEVGVFQSMEVIRTTGSNTIPLVTTTSATNTITPITCHKGMNTKADDEVVDHKTVKEFRDCGVNTSSDQSHLSLSKVECVDVGGEQVKAVPQRPLTMQEQIIQRGASQAFAFLGSTSSADSLSPTSPKRLLSQSENESVANIVTETFSSSTSSQQNTQSAGVGDAAGDSCFSPVSSSNVKNFDGQPSSESSSVQNEQDLPCAEENSFEDTDSPQDVPSGRRDPVAEMISQSCSGGRFSKHRNIDGVKSSQLTTQQGIYSGRRVGSVEDFMPDDMRRLMNIDTVESGDKVQVSVEGSESSKTEWVVTRTVRTVTTKRLSQDGGITESTTSSDDSDVSTRKSVDKVEETASLGKGFGKLSLGHFDLSKIADDDDSAQDASSEDAQSPMIEGTESGKDSGYSDNSMTTSTVDDNSSLQGLDLAMMGSLEQRELKSIMKKSRSDTATPKKGISFADSVVGGTGSSSEEEATESDESTTSYDEGSYDGREGDITYECQDDEAIAQGLPGAKMYDQNIRETYELGEEMEKACNVLANYLVDSTTIQTKELNANLSVVQAEWFRVSSHKLSSVHQVEDYLSSINEISPRLLEYIVNLVDDNGNAAIHYCVSHCNFDIVGLLLDTEVCDVKKPNKAGYTPTMLASLAHVQNEDHREIICRLFATGDVNAFAEKTGQTALMLATSQCRADMVQLLLEAGANCNAQDFDGSTALMCACEHGHGAVVQLLLAHPDCDANLKDNEGSNALSIAMEAGHKDIGVILYKHLNFSKSSSPVSESLDAPGITGSTRHPTDDPESSPEGSSEALWTPSSYVASDRESSPETEV